MNPSGLCLCGCGLPTSIALYDDKLRGYVAGQHKLYLRGHAARTERMKEHMRIILAPLRERQRKARIKRLKALARKRAAQAKKRREMRAFMQARRELTRKLGPYKAGRTVMAQKAVGKIEAAMKRMG